MRRLKCVVALLSLAAIIAVAMSACSKGNESLELSNVRQVANLSTLECTYHNVARYGNEASEIPLNFLRIGYKKYWFEYDATVEVGVDAMKIDFVTIPEGDGEIVMTMPEAELITQPNVITSTMTDPLTETGVFTGISDDDRKTALVDAQQFTREQVSNDEALKFQARERAKQIVERYVVNVGNELGRKYTVKFIYPSEKTDTTN